MSKQNEFNIKRYNKKYIELFNNAESDRKNALILTDKISLPLNSDKTKINNNVLLVGATGSGKYFCFSQPNILQCNCNFVITDPYGHLFETTSDFLKQSGYDIKVLNLLDTKKSNKYNPLKYIETEEDISMLASTIIKPHKNNLCSNNQNYIESAIILLEILITYTILHNPKPQPTLSDVLQLLYECEVIGSGVNFVSKLDLIFNNLKEQEPSSPAIVKFNEFKPKTINEYKTILLYTSVCLTCFNLKDIENIISDDEFDLTKIDNEKTAIFIILPPADTTFNFIASILISQIMKELYRTAIQNQNKKLKHYTQFIFYEFNLLERLYYFPKFLKKMQKYNMSCSIIIEQVKQLKDIYDDWTEIAKSCDVLLFFGGHHLSTLDYFAKEMETFKYSSTKAVRLIVHRIYRKYYNDSFPEFHFNDILNVDVNKCLLIIRNIAMIEDEKFSCTKHKNFKYLKTLKKEIRYENRWLEY